MMKSFKGCNLAWSSMWTVSYYMLEIACMIKYDDEKVWVLLRCKFIVCISWYIQKKKNKFGWMEMGIVVKIQVPIHWPHQIQHWILVNCKTPGTVNHANTKLSDIEKGLFFIVYSGVQVFFVQMSWGRIHQSSQDEKLKMISSLGFLQFTIHSSDCTKSTTQKHDPENLSEL